VELAWFPESADEVNLVVLAQGTTHEGAGCELLEFSYSPVNGTLRVHSCLEGNWNADIGAPIELELHSGDRLVVVVQSFSAIYLKLGDEVVGEWSIEGFPYDQGAVGVSGVSHDDALYFDNFSAQEL